MFAFNPPPPIPFFRPLKCVHIILTFVNSCFSTINYVVQGKKLVFVYRSSVEIPSNSIKYAKIWFIDIQVLEYLIVQNYNFPQNPINICFHIIFSHCLSKLDVQMYCYSQIILWDMKSKLTIWKINRKC
jgi:hypothetical protein